MRIFLVLFCVAMALLGCKKSSIPEIVFPAETREGLNTFGAYIDGVPFIAATTLFGNVKPVNGFYTPVATSYYRAGFLSIQGIDARYSLDQAGVISIQKQEISGPGEFPLYHSFACPQLYGCDAGAYENARLSRAYFIDTGRLTITRLDTVAKIISGRFSFASSDPQGNRHQVTGGVFDIRYDN
jgi:hypothetical protein